MTTKKPLAARVWETLSAINVNEHTEKKGNLTYLSWAWAWQTLMENYPNSLYEFEPPVNYDDGTAEVWVTVTITEGEEAIFRRMWLPVMDHRNKAVANPDSRAISDTRMRCLVKCLAMFGLGHYIYAGEDVPANAPSYTAEQKKYFDDYLTGSALGFYLFRKRVGDEIYTDLYNSFEDGKKVANKKLADDQERIGGETFAAIMEHLEGGDEAGVYELLEDESNTVVALLKAAVTTKQRDEISAIVKQAKAA